MVRDGEARVLWSAGVPVGAFPSAHHYVLTFRMDHWAASVVSQVHELRAQVLETPIHARGVVTSQKLPDLQDRPKADECPILGALREIHARVRVGESHVITRALAQAE